MEVWLNPATKNKSEFLSVWIRVGLLLPSEVKTDIGEKKVFDRGSFKECEVRFWISSGKNRGNDIEAAFRFIRWIRQLIEG